MLVSLSEDVDFSQVLGAPMCVGLTLPSGGERFFHGSVAEFRSVGSEGEFTLYEAVLTPDLFRLSLGSNCRIYQNKTVTHIIDTILKKYGIRVEHDPWNTERYLPWEYCVQYRESDLAFVSRLMEYEGIHYWFKHTQDAHIMVLADSNHKHEDIQGYEQVEYTRAVNMQNRRVESVWDWRFERRVQADTHSATDFDFRKPGANLSRASNSEVRRDFQRGGIAEVDFYDPPIAVVQQDTYSPEAVRSYMRLRSDELHSTYEMHSAKTDARGLCAGAKFKLDQGPNATQGKDFLIVATTITAEVDLRGSGAGSNAPIYTCSLKSIDYEHVFRPQRKTPKPLIPGPQSAIVTGQGGDFETDDWGRVFLKFHWARPQGDDDKDISCWVRVSQNSAGANWGSMFVPHIGQEVIVGFYEGDPDRPVVIGRVYNGQNKPPLALPGNAEKSIIRDHFGNEVLWDASGITIHSQKSASVLGADAKGTKMCTEGSESKVSYNAISYNRGFAQSYTLGETFSLSRGTSASVTSGTKVDAFCGASIGMAVGPAFDFKAGASVSICATASFAWGFARDFKDIKGEYSRVSDGDVQMRSKKSVYIAGGGDHSVFLANKEEISLSFDPAFTDRSGEFANRDAKAKKLAAAAAALSAVSAGLGSWAYASKATITGETKHNCDGEIRVSYDHDIEALTDHIGEDWSALGTAILSAGAIKAALCSDMPEPKHPGATAKITLRNELVEIFASKTKDELMIKLDKKFGIAMKAEKPIVIESKQGVKLASKDGIMLSAKGTVQILGELEHKYMKIGK